MIIGLAGLEHFAAALHRSDAPVRPRDAVSAVKMETPFDQVLGLSDMGSVIADDHLPKQLNRWLNGFGIQAKKFVQPRRPVHLVGIDIPRPDPSLQLVFDETDCVAHSQFAFKEHQHAKASVDE